MAVTDEQREAIRRMSSVRMDANEIAAQLGMKVASVRAVIAHIARGTYSVDAATKGSPGSAPTAASEAADAQYRVKIVVEEFAPPTAEAARGDTDHSVSPGPPVPPSTHPAHGERVYHRVQVSGRILQIPRFCCCCGQPEYHAAYQATATRVSGKRVIKTETRTWEFPVCAPCQRWIVAQRRAEKLFDSAGMALLFTVGSGAVAAAVPSARETATGLAALAGLICAILFLVWLSARSAANRCKPAAVCSSNPVEFVEWDGSVLTFRFRNSAYCEAFMAANGKKLLGF